MLALGYGMSMGRFDSSYLLLIGMMILASFASMRVSSTFSKFSNTPSMSGLTGREVAQLILNRQGINDVTIQPVAGHLSDHYDPRTKTVRLSENVYNSNSISAISVAAHEVGHAIQHHESYFFLTFRSALAPVVSFTSNFVMILILAGIFLQFFALAKIGVILYALAVLFHIITLPVEYDASRRAKDLMEDYRVISPEEKGGVKKVLGAAALTYVASTLVAIVQLLRFVSMVNRRD